MPATKEDIDRVNKAKNHYEVLGVPPTASHDEIRKAYKDLSKLLHPDKNQGVIDTTAVFQKINSAHEVLSDQDARQRYDMSQRVQNAPKAEASKQEMSLGEKLLNALKSFCDAVSSFLKSFTSKQEQKQDYEGPKHH
ncbi:TPA: J domain-containing protein [Legionella pneumophila]|nr:J domain-containing protein [Legionella pneumophila]HAT2065482.1 J domain-containing protein [Legionella pneumophila]HAT8591975.1 DnaJ domain-containing protein [Legionella pneumophila]HAU1575713.1 J domain-containing protein [Legionella pneumophila]HAU1679720.1 J domain-containing protein [Legionella pneumophila]HAU3699399.1 J domain-containing protein [Legionella pneumophila]